MSYWKEFSLATQMQKSLVPMTDEIRQRHGIVTDPRRNRRHHVDNAFSIGIPLVGTLLAIASMAWLPPSAEVMLIFAITFALTTTGASLGLHRYFTHRSYKTSRAGHAILALCATMTMQGTIIRWVADHRRHHRFTDQSGDLHSPYFDSSGRKIESTAKGLLHAHVTWMFTVNGTEDARYAPELLKDGVCVWYTKHYWSVNALVMLLCGASVYILTHDAAQALLGVLYAGCIRVTLIQNFTWAVNSIGHTYGARVVDAKDQSTNNLLLSLLTLGDGLHSSHHQSPTRGVNPPQYLDMGGMLLIGLEKIGVIWQLKR